MRTYNVQGTVLDAGHTEVNKIDKTLTFMEFIFHILTIIYPFRLISLHQLVLQGKVNISLFCSCPFTKYHTWKDLHLLCLSKPYAFFNIRFKPTHESSVDNSQSTFYSGSSQLFPITTYLKVKMCLFVTVLNMHLFSMHKGRVFTRISAHGYWDMYNLKSPQP